MICDRSNLPDAEGADFWLLDVALSYGRASDAFLRRTAGPPGILFRNVRALASAELARREALDV